MDRSQTHTETPAVATTATNTITKAAKTSPKTDADSPTDTERNTTTESTLPTTNNYTAEITGPTSRLSSNSSTAWSPEAAFWNDVAAASPLFSKILLLIAPSILIVLVLVKKLKRR